MRGRATVTCDRDEFTAELFDGPQGAVRCTIQQWRQVDGNTGRIESTHEASPVHAA